jgi:DNA-3-methyladenine glycosylase I
MRCFGSADPLMAAYHDEEWGVPVHGDRLLFEHLVLDGFQAGLSWRTILYKRQAFREAFEGFDPERLARYDGRQVRRLMNNPGIVRNRLKIEAVIDNARAVLALRDQGISLDDHLWSFTGGQVLRGRPRRTWEKVPTSNRISDAMAKDLRERGFSFVGTTICYAFMQAVGMIDDHLVDCHRFRSPDDGPIAAHM